MTGTQVTKYDEEWAKRAQRAVEDEPQGGGSFLSIRGGILKFQDTEMPGNQACVIILDSVRENTYYGAKFDEDNPMPPKCYAFGRGGEEMAPHISMAAAPAWFEPQSETCQTCPFDKFGSADVGRGKACQDRRRIALIPAGFYSPKKNSRDFDLELITEPKHYQTADIAFLKLPVMSVKPWSSFVTQVSSIYTRPPAGVLTRLFVVPDAKAQYKVQFEVIDLVPDELAAIVMARVDEAVKAIIQPYNPPEA